MTTSLTPAQAARQASRSSTGQYAEMAHLDPGELELAPTSVWQERRQALLDGGFVPAKPALSRTPARVAGDAGAWWDEHFASGEYAHPEGTYPKMPDDISPSMGAGDALSGRRRTYRMAYSGAGTTLRMPSVSSIRTFAADPRNRTFDIPVTVSTPDGREISGWVRATGEGHLWDTQALGFDGADQAAVAEAVTAVLEARRPTRALAEAGDLVARVAARQAAAGVTSRELVSSWITTAGYDGSSGTMVMTTNSGRSYGFQVDRNTFETMVGSHSPGRVFNQLIKGQSHRTEVTQCALCHRWSTVGGHHCVLEPAPRGPATAFDDAARNSAARRLAART